MALFLSSLRLWCIMTDKEFSVTVGGNRRVSLQDISKVVLAKYKVFVEPSVLQKCDQTHVNEPLINMEGLKTLSSPRPLDLAICKAALFCKIVSLSLGHGARSTLLSLLCKLLNMDLIPVLHDMNGSGDQLIAALLCMKEGSYYYCGSKLMGEEAKHLLGDDALVQLTQNEFILLKQNTFAYVGYAGLICAWSEGAASALDCVAALSAEVMGAEINILPSIDAMLFDVGRQHRGQMSSAANLRLLLEGSSRMTGRGSQDPDCFLTIPQGNGPVQEVVTAVTKYALQTTSSTILTHSYSVGCWK